MVEKRVMKKSSVNISKSLISIVIPVYNVGKYLKQMLESIYAQTYKHFEIIAAYDTKSTDNSLDILTEYSEKYGLIIDQALDTSSGCARNRGLRQAKGDFVIFFDGDDLVVPTYLENLMEVFIEYPELDVVCGSFWKTEEINVNRIYKKSISSKTSSVVYDKEDALERWLPTKKLNFVGKLFGAPWTWLVRREFLLEHCILFPDYSYGDDLLYTGRVIFNSERIGYTKKKGYVWILHPMSTFHTEKSYDECCFREKRVQDDLRLLLAKQYPKILSRLRSMREVPLNKRYLFELWNLSYEEFIQKLQEKNLMHLEYSELESFIQHLSTFCFNHVKWIYFFVHKRLFSVCKRQENN